MYEFDDYDDEEEGSSRFRRIAAIAVLLAVVATGWFVVRPALGDDDGGSTAGIGTELFDESTTTSSLSTSSSSSTSIAAAAVITEPETTEPETTVSETTVPETTGPETTGPETTGPETTGPETTVPETTVPEMTEPETTEPASTQPATSELPSTTASATSSTAGATYDTLVDGTPAPVNVVIDGDHATLSGSVPSSTASLRLVQFVGEFAGSDVDVVDELTVNPAVPVGVGVRLVDLNSTPFGDGRTDIGPELADELDRLAALLNQHPNTSIVVVGHADQRGTPEANLDLSQRRAASVLAYLTSHGIAGSRVSSRAAGEEDLLSLDNDDASLALNRRTEFIVFGVFVE